MSRVADETLHNYTAKVRTNKGTHRCNVIASDNFDAIVKAGLKFADEHPVSVDVTLLNTIRMRGTRNLN